MSCHRTHTRSFAVVAMLAIAAALHASAVAVVDAVSRVARTCWNFVAPVLAREPSVASTPPAAALDSGVDLVAAKAYLQRRAQREHDRLRQAWRTCPAL